MGIFRQAVQAVARRGILPTNLASADLGQIDASILERAFFSARVAMAELLSGMRERIMALVAGQQPGPGQYTNPATVRADLKEMLDAMDYQPEEGKAGTIQDLRSDQRLNLIIRTNEQMATGYGQKIQSLDPDTIDQWPAWELVRVEDRKEKRTWVQRWRAAGGTVYPGRTPGLSLEEGFSEGRLIALKTDPIWASISRFGQPQPPFDFNSGVGVEDVDRATTDELGITSPEQTIDAPPINPREMASTAQASGTDLPDDLRQVLVSEGYKFTDGVLTT